MNILRVKSHTIFLLCLLVLQFHGQDIPRIKLNVRDVTVNESLATIDLVAGAIKCDSAGNIFLRLPNMNMRVGSVLEISPEAKKVASYVPPASKGFDDFDIGDFAIGRNGDVYEAISRMEGNDPKVEILVFKDGVYDSKIILDEMFSPAILAVFGENKFLLAGRKLINSSGASRMFTAIFDDSGRLVKELVLDAKKQNAIPSQEDDPALSAQISSSEILNGRDGNLYLMEPKTSPQVLVITPQGKILRQVTVNPPKDRSETWAMKLSYDGRFIFEFGNSSDTSTYTIYSSVDQMTGKRLVDYVIDNKNVGGLFACSGPNEFTFLASTPNNKLVLRHVRH